MLVKCYYVWGKNLWLLFFHQYLKKNNLALYLRQTSMICNLCRDLQGFHLDDRSCNWQTCNQLFSNPITQSPVSLSHSCWDFLCIFVKFPAWQPILGQWQLFYVSAAFVSVNRKSAPLSFLITLENMILSCSGRSMYLSIVHPPDIVVVSKHSF